MFFFVRYALVFCIVAFLLALFADVLMWLALVIVGHFVRGGGIGFLAGRSQWLAIFAVWWATAFFIAIPLARRFAGLPIRLF
jgi:Kef-type K+ transport system membrane component KefB